MKKMNNTEMMTANAGTTYKCKWCGQSWKGNWFTNWYAQYQRNCHQRYCPTYLKKLGL